MGWRRTYTFCIYSTLIILNSSLPPSTVYDILTYHPHPIYWPLSRLIVFLVRNNYGSLWCDLSVQWSVTVQEYIILFISKFRLFDLLFFFIIVFIIINTIVIKFSNVRVSHPKLMWYLNDVDMITI